MATYSGGTIKSFTRAPSAFAFTIEYTNPDPPPPLLSKTFMSVPDWVRDSVIPNLGKSVSVNTDGGTPETITSVTVSA